MKKLFLILTLLAAPAFAGEKYLGTIAGTAGPTTKDNSNTASPFVIQQRAKLSIQCDAAAYIAVDVVNGATSTNGVLVQTNVMFTTSVGDGKVVIGSVRSAVVSVIGSAGAVNCRVFERRGDE